MPALMKTNFGAKVVWIGHVADRASGMRSVEVPTLDGRKTLRVPPGTRSGSVPARRAPRVSLSLPTSSCTASSDFLSAPALAAGAAGRGASAGLSPSARSTPSSG